MTANTVAPKPTIRAERCASCNRALVRDSGADVPHIGIVGPECRHKYGDLLADVASIEGLTFGLDQGSQRLAHYALCALHNSGLEVTKQVQDGTLRLIVGGLRPRYTGAGVLTDWRDRREGWAQQLQLAQAEREGWDGMEASVMLSARVQGRGMGL